MTGVIDYTYLDPETTRNAALERMGRVAWLGRLTLLHRKLVKITLGRPAEIDRAGTILTPSTEVSFYAERRPDANR